MATIACLLLLTSGCSTPDEYRFGGFVEAEQIEVGSRVGGRVLKTFVDDGDEVHAGDILVQFETMHLEAQLHAAQFRASRLTTTMKKLEAGPRPQEIAIVRDELAAATARLKNATAQYKRGLDAGEAVMTKEKLETLETAVTVATSEEQAKREELALLEEGTRIEDIIIARHDMEEAEAEVVRLKDQLNEGTVKAPVDAIVEVFDVEPGDLVAGGAPLAVLVRKDELWVRCFVPATLLSYIRTGQKVKVTVDARPGDVFEGEVLRINRLAEYTPRNVQTFEQREDQVFGVKVRVSGADDVLRPGMAAVVHVPRTIAKNSKTKSK